MLRTIRTALPPRRGHRTPAPILPGRSLGHTCFGSGSPDGVRVAGLMFGVFAALRLAGLNPYTWVLDYLGACADTRGQPPERLDPWLPWRMDEDRKRELRGPLSASTAPTALLPRQPDPRRAGRSPISVKLLSLVEV